MSIATEMSQALEELERDLSQESDGTPQKFGWRGIALPCIPRTIEVQTVIDPHGNMVDVQLSMSVRASHFVTVDTDSITADDTTYTGDNDLPIPKSGDVLTFPFAGSKYRVIKVNLSPARDHYTLYCADPNSNQ
tara:strand:+ start:905 stop:1306 length:402 start_codon:yes stop_codon:yes gene_type:complete